MLKLTDDVLNISLLEELSNSKSQTLPHSIDKSNELYKPIYKVYVEADKEDTTGQLVETTEWASPVKNKAIQLTEPKSSSDWVTFFSEPGVADTCDDCLEGAISVNVLVDVTTVYNKSLGDNITDTEVDVVGDTLEFLPDLSGQEAGDGDYAVINLTVPFTTEDPAFNHDFDISNLDAVGLKLTKNGNVLTLTGNETTVDGKTLSIVNNKISVSGFTVGEVNTSKCSFSVEKIISTPEETKEYELKPIAKVDFGKNGYNKNHEQKNATITKNSNFINGLKIALSYSVDEVRFVSLGTLKPSTGEITINNSIVINDGVLNTVENTALLNEIIALDNINNVCCTTINRSEEDIPAIINWDTTESELKELHPKDENGNTIENIDVGTVRLQISETPDAHGSLDPQEEGCVILADKAVKELKDSYGFTRLVLDEETATSNGVLNRFRSVSITPEIGEASVYFEKEAYSVGTVFYNTGVIELKEAVPVIMGTAPSLKCSVTGMKNLKATIKNKGTDGDKYSLLVTKQSIEVNGDVIYNVSIRLGESEIDSITCSSNPDGSIIEGTDASGNVIDVDVPFIGELDHDLFFTTFNGEDEDLKSLHNALYSFSGGSDGTAGITASDYIGEKTEDSVTGAWLFDDVKYAAQIFPSLGYTDKEFYMGAQEIAWNRKDTTCVWDVPKGYSKKTAIQFREEEPIPDKWWTELYYNWCNDVYNGTIVELPPSYYVTKNSLASYKIFGTWYPVAGKERGTIDAASVINQVPAKLDRDEFITHNINPIYDTGNQGIQIYGNETLNASYTDLSAAHISRTLTYIRSKVDTFTETLKFELNDVVLWRRWIDYVKTKILEPIKAQRGLQWFRVSMGGDTTTREELANRIVRGVIELQFTPDAEIFKLDYVVYSSAADNSTF